MEIKIEKQGGSLIEAKFGYGIKPVPCLGSLFRGEVYAYVYVYLMEYVLASFVNMTQSSITQEEGLNAELCQLVWSVGMSLRDWPDYVNCEGKTAHCGHHHSLPKGIWNV